MSILKDIANPNSYRSTQMYHPHKTQYTPRKKERVSICPTCDWQWGPAITSSYYTSADKQVRYEPGTLPRYGKPKKECGRCSIKDKTDVS
jgi:hypothetical protein